MEGQALSDPRPLGPREKEKEDRGRRGGGIEIGGEMDGKGEKEGKKWKYMLHDPRIGNPTYPRAKGR